MKPSYSQSLLIALCLCSKLSSPASSLAAAASTRPPNIVIIFTDDLGYADVGVLGAKGFKTPNLDRLASEGRIFRNFHVAQPVCSASRAALLTGCYPNRIGIHGALGPNAAIGISDSEMTMAELVKQRGYATAIYGKWHLGSAQDFLPLRHGFDEYFGLPYSNDMWPLHPEYVNLPPEIARKKRGYPPLPLIEGNQAVNTNVTAADQNMLTTWYTEHAVNFIAANKQQPFFLYLAHSMPHVPLHVSEKLRGKTERGLYGDVIAEIDWSVGQVLEALRQNKLAENTLVIFTSDNGPWLSYGGHAGSADPLREGKGTCWEGGTRVPCIMRWPGEIPAGTVSQQMLMTIDLFPTLAKLIDAQLPRHRIDGLDVWPIICGRTGATNPHPAYAFYYENNQLQAVVTGDGRWKLQLPHTYRSLAGRVGKNDGTPIDYTQTKIESSELYDLRADPGEQQNVAKANTPIVQMLEGFAGEFRKELGDSLKKMNGAGSREAGRVARAQ